MIRGDAWSGGRSASSIIGRDAEIAELSRLVHESLTGRGRGIVIDGEPGIGKTTLLDLVHLQCRENGARILRGRADDLERRLPFAAIASCLDPPHLGDDPNHSQVAALLRGDGTQQSYAEAAADHEFVVTEAFLDLVDGWCATGPVALLLDDLQWADPHSLLVLRQLNAVAEQAPLLVVGAIRPAPRSDELVALLRSLDVSRWTRLRLEPLHDAATAELVRALVAADVGPTLRRVVAAAGGNPLYITELVMGLSQHIEVNRRVADLPITQRGRAEIPAAAVPGGTLHTAISERLSLLRPDALDILRVAATLGPSFDLAELGGLLETGCVGLVAVVDQATEHGLVIDSGQRFTFRHDVIRRVLADELSLSVRSALHQQFAAHLAGSGARPERVAEHLVQGSTLDGKAVQWLVGAARSLTQRAPELAVALLERALQRGYDDAQSLDLRVHLVYALAWSGRHGEAVELARFALAGMEGGGRALKLRWVLVIVLFRLGRLRESIEEAHLAVASRQSSPIEAGRFHGLIAHCHFFLGAFDEAIAAGEAAAAEESREPFRDYIVSGVRLMQRRVAEAMDLAAHVADRVSRREDLDRYLSHQLIHAVCLTELDRLTQAEAFIENALRMSERGLGLLLPGWYHWLLADLRFIGGRWDDALAEVVVGLAAVDHLGSANVLNGVKALIAVHRGDVNAYAAATQDASPGPAAALFGWHRRWAGMLAVEASGEPERALELLVAEWEHGADGIPPHAAHHLCLDITRLAMVLGHPDLIRRVTEAVECLTVVHPADSLRATAMLCRGVLDRDPDATRLAALSYRETGRRLAEANAWEITSELASRRGTASARITAAKKALAASLRIYDDCGATWDARRATARLAEFGIRHRQSGRRRPMSGWDALSETERRIAAMVAAGRSNLDTATELFLSRRTVQHHVSSVLTKLGLASRAELAVAAVQKSIASTVMPAPAPDEVAQPRSINRTPPSTGRG